ncbi:MAG: FAD-dependent monooxygenase [Armatimonadota bacterium]
MNSNLDTPASAPVVIIGAGPTGLSLALGLARQGVRSMLLEKKPATSEYSKAPGIHVRTREVFRQWGVEEHFLKAGVLKQAFTMYHAVPGRRPLVSLDMAELDAETDRPGILFLEQSITERLLLDAVRASGLCDVRFGAEAVGLAPRADGAVVTVRTYETEYRLDVPYIVGCDGASSFTRDALGLPFDGITYAVRPMLADVRVTDARDGLPWPRMCNAPGGLSFTFRLEPGLWRLVRIDLQAPPEGDEVPPEDVNRRVEELLGAGPVEVVWASRFRIHRRAVPRFRFGRVLLAGDAAHVHSPIGGQGMNAGIQDAHNLAWKLATTLNGGDEERLLDSYDVERHAVVVGNVSRYTNLMTRIFLQAPRFFRDLAFFLLRQALVSARFRRAALRRTAMIDLDYPASPLLHAEELSAGVRLPNPLLQSPDGNQARLYHLLPNRPVILDVAEDRAFSTALPVADVLMIGPRRYRDASGLLRGLLGGQDGWILVRPDAHVAWARQQRKGIEEAISLALGRTRE